MEGRTLVQKDDLAEISSLLKLASARLLTAGEESLAVECEQTAEMIDGYYLPYNEQGVYVGATSNE